ncbi:hypothetical protein ACFXPS_05530 [Nocardia sp. NPDC059091]|uniref:hypothetical protein n=1 Tax=unclassified Nocardia TaxID=2637762 RepID=UPI0036866031
MTGDSKDWKPGTRVWWFDEAYIVSKSHDPNFGFGIIMPPGTPAIDQDASEPGEPDVKSTEPPKAGLVPVHWDALSKCYWEPAEELVAELQPDVQEWADNLRAQYRRDQLRVVSKRVRKPALTLTVDEEFKQRVEKSLRAVNSSYREHVLAFLRWFMRETDELPPRPDYPIPYFAYGESVSATDHAAGREQSSE